VKLRERIGATGGISPGVGGPDLVGMLDSLAARRPAGDPWLPVVVLRGAGAGPFLRRYRDRLVADGGGPIVAHARLDGARLSAAGDVALLDALARGLGRGMPAGTGRLRLPAYWMVRAVLDAEVDRGDERARRRDLVARLYASQGRRRDLVARLDPAPPDVSGNAAWHLAAVVVGPAVRGLAHASLGWRLARSRRFRWLGDQLPAVTGQRGDFVDTALHLVDERDESRDDRGGDERSRDELVRRVLVLALLHDLDGATRRSLVSPARRRRVGPFTVLVDGVGDGSAARRLLDTVGELDPREVPRRGTTLVVAALAPPRTPSGAAPAPPEAPGSAAGRSRWRRRARPPRARGAGRAGPGEDDVVDDGLGPGLPPDEAAERLAAAAHGRRTGPPVRRLVVDLPADPGPARRQGTARKVAAPRPAGAVAVPVATATLATLLVGALAWATVRALEPDPGCPGIDTAETGEPVGLADGTARCSFFAALPDARGEDRRAVEAEIASENAEVLAAAEQGQPYRTIVFFAPLTLPDEPEREGQDALPQLRGIATAQRWANEAARSDVNRVRARVVLANPGDRFRHGPQVARRIVAEARRRDDLVGVVGIAQSRWESREAVRILGEAGLPVVAGPVTGDAMIDSSPHYYQVSPRNNRVASVLAEFTRRAPLVRSGATSPGTPADRAVIVKDHSDEYSENLANDLHERFTEAGGEVVRTISYPVAEPDLPAEPRSGVPPADRVGSLDQLAERLCGSLVGEREVVFFAGRSQQLQGLLNSVRSRPGCGARPLTVVAGTDTTKFVEAASAGRPGRLEGVDLYYGAFAAPGIEPTEAADTFLARYVDAYGQGSIRVDMSDPALVYDAFTALQLAVNHTRRSDLDMTASDVAGALSGNEVRFDGATGYVALDDAQPISRVPPDKPVLVLRATDGMSEVHLACGRFTEGDTGHRRWGVARTPCPVED
jgi:ABC-type branched-subunit amino acid transport system substrate-binding protein